MLRTRLLPPRLPPGCVARPALVAAVDEGLRGRLVAVVAGAGYGKSTLLAQALAASEVPWVWCSCDARLAGAEGLLRHIAAGVRERFPGFGAGLRLNGAAGDLVAALANEVVETVGEDFVIALDDVHMLGPEALEAVGRLVDDLPPNAHLALVGRSPLPFPLGRLRALRVVEIGEDRLAFGHEETADLLRSLGVEPDPARLAELLRRTEGWPAGLILAARSDGDGGAERAGFDYLAEEVLARQARDLREFLLDTAVLGRFSPELAAEVSGRADAAQVCRGLVAGHLFAVRLDDPGEWYRYHHLLQAFLRQRLADDPDRLRDRNLRAAAWWHHRGDPVEAVRHLLAAGDAAGAVDVLEPVAERMVLTAEGATLARLLDEIPEALWGGRPALLLAQVGLALHRAGHEAAFAAAEAAIERLIDLGDHDRAAAALVRLQQAMITAGTRPGRRIDSGERFAPQIAARAPLLPIARILLATAYGYACRFEEAEEELRGALALPAAAGSEVHRGYADVARAFYVEQWTRGPAEALGSLDSAVARLERADPDDPLSFRLFARVLRSYVMLELGRHSEVLGLVDALRAEFGRRGAAEVLLRAARWVRSTALAGQGRWDELGAEFEPPPRAPDPASATSYGYRYRAPAALLAGHRRDAAEAEAQIAAARKEMAAFGRAFDDGWFLCDFAVAAAAAGLPGLARRQARDALAAAEPLGSPWAAARAALVAAHVGEGPDGGDAHLERALALTHEHGLGELWSAREELIAPALAARALARGLGPPGAAEQVVAACGARALGLALEAGDADAALRTRLADLAGTVPDVDIELVDRLLRDRDQGVRDAARRAWSRVKGRPRASISIRLLGDFAVARDGVAVPLSAFTRTKARALLACLVAARGPVHREALCDRLWPELPPERAAAALRSTLHDLRRAVEPEVGAGSPESIIATDGDAVRLALTGRDRCDALDFARLAARAADGDLGALQAAEAGYGGPFAPEWPYDDWAAGPRTELEQTYRHLVARLAAALVRAGRPEDAVPRYRRLLAREPEREGWHRELMRAYAAAGERALALRQFHACRTVLRREQGIEPDPETRALYAALLREEPPAL